MGPCAAYVIRKGQYTLYVNGSANTSKVPAIAIRSRWEISFPIFEGSDKAFRIDMACHPNHENYKWNNEGRSDSNPMLRLVSAHLPDRRKLER